MDILNTLFGALGAIAALIAIVQFVRSGPSGSASVVWIAIFFLGLGLFVLIPLWPVRYEIVQYGPYFFCVSPSESAKRNFKLVKPGEIVLVNPNFPGNFGRVEVTAEAGLWSQKEERAFIAFTFSDLQGCDRRSTLVFSRALPQDNAENYRDPFRMEHDENSVVLDCPSPIRNLSISVDPGTWALSVNSIRVFGVSKVNLLTYVRKQMFM